jgi:hypothetical protein
LISLWGRWRVQRFLVFLRAVGRKSLVGCSVAPFEKLAIAAAANATFEAVLVLALAL